MAGLILNGFVAVDPVASVVPVSLKVSMVAEGFHGNRGWCCGARASDFRISLPSPRRTLSPEGSRRWKWCTRAGNNESAGKVKSSRSRPGNPYLRGALGAAAMVCRQNPSTYYGARYRRIASRRGPKKASVAIQHSMLIAIWHMGTTGTLYDEPGADYFTRLTPGRAKKRAIHQLEASGYHVTLHNAS